MKKNHLNDKYTGKELAESFVFRNKLTPAQKEAAKKELNAKRQELGQATTAKEMLLSRLLQLKYQMEDYLANSDYDNARTFGFFLKGYLEMLNKKNKEFAADIDINQTELSQIINNHRSPSEKVIIRLELHSNKIIPAIMWHKLVEKEKEYQLMHDSELRAREKSHVRNALAI
ncbi:helix-turn-helix transcriptional regulator [Fluviicola sp.]|uniref:helix-turn-helix domain-containing protein n=1 Tax=Fluviicola sp. TaxID=1917219 RepID=UPI0031D9648B